MTDAREFTTQDMALAATLLVEGYTHDRLDNVAGGCQWVYDHPSAGLMVVVEDYLRDEHFVDPKELVRKLGLIRRDMYEFLGHNPKRVRT